MIYNLQALRAIAALMVVVLHLGGTLKPIGLPDEALSAGAAGVDLFFVISGFVMVHSVSARPTGGGAFMLNRIVRVAPLYWLVTIVIGAAALAMPHVFRTVSATPERLILSLAFIPHFSAQGAVQPVLFVGWTLNYEMFFYLIFAGALALMRTPSRTAVATLIALVGLIVLGRLVHFNDAAGRTFTDPILFEFGFGMILALVFKKIRHPAPLVAYAAILVAFATIIVQPYVLVDTPRSIVWGVPAVAIVFGAVSLEQAGISIRNTVVQKLGASSYALYLIHPIPLGVGSRLSSTFGSPILALVLALLLLAAVIIVGYAVHLFVEKPLTIWLRSAAGGRSRMKEGPSAVQ